MASVTEKRQKLSPSEIAESIRGHGGLIGVTAAARLLGIKAPNFKRDVVERGLLTALQVHPPTSPVYLRHEVEALARARKRASSNGRSS